MNTNSPPGAPLSTAASLESDLRALGVREGDALFVQCAFRSLGPVAGGAATVVDALSAVVGAGGLILMPSFHLIERGRRASEWDPARSPSTTGWLSEYFRRMPGTMRSDHYSHAVAARGVRASQWVGGDGPDTGLISPWDQAPWMRTFGDRSPLFRCYAWGARALMLGTTYESLTSLHLVEVMDWNRRLAERPDAEYRWLDRAAAGRVWEEQGKILTGRIGQAPSRLFGIRDLVDFFLAHLSAHPSLFKIFSHA